MEEVTKLEISGNTMIGRRAEALPAADAARLVVEVASDRKATDVVLLDIRPLSYLADYFVICTGESERQIKAIVDALTEKLRSMDVRAMRVEGQSSSGWIILDYGDVIVHVFSPAMRDFYKLEKVWGEAPLVLRIQ